MDVFGCDFYGSTCAANIEPPNKNALEMNWRQQQNKIHANNDNISKELAYIPGAVLR